MHQCRREYICSHGSYAYSYPVTRNFPNTDNAACCGYYDPPNTNSGSNRNSNISPNGDTENSANSNPNTTPDTHSD